MTFVPLGLCVARWAAAPRLTQNLMDNFKSYHASLVARLEMVRRKMSAQTVGDLVDIGRRLTSVDFVVFLLGYHDVQSLELAPLAAASESLSHEAVVVARRVQTTIESLTCDRDSVWRIQGWATVTVLLLGFCAPRELASLWCALRYTRHGRAFPTLCRHLPLILLRVAFMGCQLTWQVDPREIDASKVKLVAPHCQCSSRRFAAPRERAPVYMQRASRIVSLPQWVAFSRHDFSDARQASVGGSALFHLRFHHHDVGARPARALQGLPLFRRSCFLPLRIGQVYKAARRSN